MIGIFQKTENILCYFCQMFQLGKTIVSEDIIEKDFACNLSTVSGLGELETPLVNNSECAYLIFNENKIAFCGIEEAYNKGEVNWKKPISCHLYPVRVKEYSEFSAVNYHKWDICDDACSLGKELKVPVYKFVKEALIRKFGNKKNHEKIFPLFVCLNFNFLVRRIS